MSIPSQLKTRRSIRLAGVLLAILMVLVISEAAAYLMISHLSHKNFYFCRLQITETYETYQSRLNPLLGWPPPNFPRWPPGFFDSTESRVIPAFPDPTRTPASVSLYGDSFTKAIGVSHEHAWANVLSQQLNCRVSNFGFNGYGPDQAYLRFRENRQDPANVVILGVFTGDIKRIVNQFRNLICSSVNQSLIKPRFILDPLGRLTLVPIPALTKREYYEMQTNPGLVFHHEFFLPDGPSGFQVARFPYLWRSIKLSSVILRDVWRGGGPYEGLYQPENPSRALDLMVAIINEFSCEAQKRGKQFVILIIPSTHDLSTYQRHRRWCYQPLIDRLSASGLAFIDAGPGFIQYLDGGDADALYSKIHRHLNEAGNHLIARIVYDYLNSKNILLPKPGAPAELRQRKPATG
jgi:hypothetical protein